MTAEQVREIASNDGKFNERDSVRRTRNDVLTRTIPEDESTLALGTRYAEVEMLRREMLADLAAVRAKNRALITPDQREKLALIEGTRPLAIVAYQAVCAGVVRPDPAAPVFAYFCFPNGPGAALRTFLNLTESQLAVFDAVGREVSRIQREAETRMNRLWPQVEFETANDPIDPARLGALRTEIRRLGLESYDARFTFVDRLRSVLTPAQEDKLRQVQEALPLRRLLPVAECEGLVPAAPGIHLLSPVKSTLRRSIVPVGRGVEDESDPRSLPLCGGARSAIRSGVRTRPRTGSIPRTHPVPGGGDSEQRS